MCCYQLKFIYSNFNVLSDCSYLYFSKIVILKLLVMTPLAEHQHQHHQHHRKGFLKFCLFTQLIIISFCGGCDNFAYICMLPTLIFLSNNFHEATICLNNVIQLHCMFVRPFQYRAIQHSGCSETPYC